MTDRTMLNGLTEAETCASASVAGLTTATKAGGAVLPVVGYMIQPAMASAYFHTKKEDPAYCLTCKPLSYRDDAQATIDELRAEVERLTREKVAIDELWSVTLAQLAEAVRRLEALKAKQIDVEAVMQLADDYAGENYKAERFGGHYCHDRDAAREALRASLLGDGGTTAMASQEKPHD